MISRTKHSDIYADHPEIYKHCRYDFDSDILIEIIKDKLPNEIVEFEKVLPELDAWSIFGFCD